ncbi:hypothetical protein E2320_000120 [Naja naja]|nr:hypothetical protein E2320_000120 [Naja naja]
MLTIHIIFRSELSEELPQGISQNSSDLKKLIFMFPVENFENPLHFRISALPEELPKAYLKIWVELNSARNITFDSELGFENTSFSCSPGWKTLKIHFIFGFELFLRSYPRHISKCGLEIIANPLHFNLSFPEELAQGISQNLGRTLFSQKS